MLKYVCIHTLPFEVAETLLEELRETAAAYTISGNYAKAAEVIYSCEQLEKEMDEYRKGGENAGD